MEQKLPKKIIILAIAGAVVLGGIAWLAYMQRQKPALPQVPTGFVPPYTNVPGGKPQGERLEELAAKPVIDIIVSQVQAAPGGVVTVNWLVTYPKPPGKLSHTALHWDTQTHFTVSDAALSETTYAHAEGDFIVKEAIIPKGFSASFTIPEGVQAVYVRVDALVEGVRYWSAEKFIEIVAP